MANLGYGKKYEFEDKIHIKGYRINDSIIMDEKSFKKIIVD